MSFPAQCCHCTALGSISSPPVCLGSSCRPWNCDLSACLCVVSTFCRASYPPSCPSFSRGDAGTCTSSAPPPSSGQGLSAPALRAFRTLSPSACSRSASQSLSLRRCHDTVKRALCHVTIERALCHDTVKRALCHVTVERALCHDTVKRACHMLALT